MSGTKTIIGSGSLRTYSEFTCYMCNKVIVLETGGYPHGTYQYYAYYETCSGNGNGPGAKMLFDGFVKWKQYFCWDCERDLETYMTNKRIENMARAK